MSESHSENHPTSAPTTSIETLKALQICFKP